MLHNHCPSGLTNLSVEEDAREMFPYLRSISPAISSMVRGSQLPKQSNNGFRVAVSS